MSIIRPRTDYFEIIVLATNPPLLPEALKEECTGNQYPDGPTGLDYMTDIITSFGRTFLLVWDWNSPQDFATTPSTMVPLTDCSSLDELQPTCNEDKLKRLSDMARIIEDVNDVSELKRVIARAKLASPDTRASLAKEHLHKLRLCFSTTGPYIGWQNNTWGFYR